MVTVAAGETTARFFCGMWEFKRVLVGTRNLARSAHLCKSTFSVVVSSCKARLSQARNNYNRKLMFEKEKKSPIHMQALFNSCLTSRASSLLLFWTQQIHPSASLINTSNPKRVFLVFSAVPRLAERKGRNPPAEKNCRNLNKRDCFFYIVEYLTSEFSGTAVSSCPPPPPRRSPWVGRTLVSNSVVDAMNTFFYSS